MFESKPRVVCVAFGYPDYPQDIVDGKVSQSLSALEAMGLDVVAAPLVVSWDDVGPVVDILRQESCDAIIAVLVSWVEPPLLIAALRPFREHPLVLWSHIVFLEGDTHVTLGALPAAGVIRETLEEMGFRFRFTYGMPGDERVAAQVPIFARAAAAERALSTARIALLAMPRWGCTQAQSATHSCVLS